MTTTDNSRADALTDDFVKGAFYAADCKTWYEAYPSAAMDVARELLAAAQQPPAPEEAREGLTGDQREALEWAAKQAGAYARPISGETLMMKRESALRALLEGAKR